MDDMLGPEGNIRILQSTNRLLIRRPLPNATKFLTNLSWYSMKQKKSQQKYLQD